MAGSNLEKIDAAAHLHSRRPQSDNAYTLTAIITTCLRSIYLWVRCLIEKDGSSISRALSREEAEMVRYAYAIPPFASIDDLSAVEMLCLADMFEGWAQSGRIGPADMARLLGWADGFRSLVAEIGADYVPPEAPVVSRPSLLKFMALKMYQ
jgi:hypothetical protein